MASVIGMSSAWQARMAPVRASSAKRQPFAAILRSLEAAPASPGHRQHSRPVHGPAFDTVPGNATAVQTSDDTAGQEASQRWAIIRAPEIYPNPPQPDLLVHHAPRTGLPRQVDYARIPGAIGGPTHATTFDDVYYDYLNLNHEERVDRSRGVFRKVNMALARTAPEYNEAIKGSGERFSHYDCMQLDMLALAYTSIPGIFTDLDLPPGSPELSLIRVVYHDALVAAMGWDAKHNFANLEQDAFFESDLEAEQMAFEPRVVSEIFRRIGGADIAPDADLALNTPTLATPDVPAYPASAAIPDVIGFLTRPGADDDDYYEGEEMWPGQEDSPEIAFLQDTSPSGIADWRRLAIIRSRLFQLVHYQAFRFRVAVRHAMRYEDHREAQQEAWKKAEQQHRSFSAQNFYGQPPQAGPWREKKYGFRI